MTIPNNDDGTPLLGLLLTTPSQFTLTRVAFGGDHLVLIWEGAMVALRSFCTLVVLKLRQSFLDHP